MYSLTALYPVVMVTCVQQQRKIFSVSLNNNICLLFSDPNKCTEIMQSLVKLSVQQSGQKIDIDPMSGAERRSVRYTQTFTIALRGT